MVTVSISIFLLIMLCLGLISFFAIWMFHDRIPALSHFRRNRAHAYNCVRCNALYSSEDPHGKSHCPKCGHLNVRLRF